MIEESLTVTRAQWNAALDYVLRSPPNPDKIFVSRGFSATYRIVQRSIDEGWDRRREKREVRKGEKSTYHKRKTVGTSAQNGRESAADTTDNDRQPPLAETRKPA